jgi:hypothetical protein
LVASKPVQCKGQKVRWVQWEHSIHQYENFSHICHIMLLTVQFIERCCICKMIRSNKSLEGREMMEGPTQVRKTCVYYDKTKVADRIHFHD